MHVTVEYMILIPVLILQIFLFPMLVGAEMGQWTGDRQSLELQQQASYIGSSIEQIYQSLNHTSILSCTLTNNLDCPPTIEGHNYFGNASLQKVSDSGSGYSQVFSITLSLSGTDISTSTSVTLGQNVVWINSTFASNPPTSCIIAQKLPNQTIQLSLGT